MRLRLAFMVLVAGFMVWGPLSRQVLKLHNPVFRPWVMFGNYGKDICDLRFYRTTDDVVYERLDRCETMGLPDCPAFPEGMWRANKRGEVDRQIKRACAAQDDDPELRAWARCGSPTVWKPLYRGKQPICEVEAIQELGPPRGFPLPGTLR